MQEKFLENRDQRQPVADPKGQRDKSRSWFPPVQAPLGMDSCESEEGKFSEGGLL